MVLAEYHQNTLKQHIANIFMITMFEFDCILLKPCLLQPCFHVAGTIFGHASLRGEGIRVYPVCVYIYIYIYSVTSHVYYYIVRVLLLLFLSLSLSLYIYIYCILQSEYYNVCMYIYIYIYICFFCNESRVHHCMSTRAAALEHTPAAGEWCSVVIYLFIKTTTKHNNTNKTNNN